MSRIFQVKPGEDLPPQALAELIQSALEGKVLAFPTDTVYGLGTSGLVPEARERIYSIKGRDPRKPLPILVHSGEEARRWVRWTRAAQVLTEWFWPGPLTLVLRPTSEGSRLLSAGAETLAIRVPAHPAILSLLSASRVPWASTSANASGKPALADGSAVIKEFVDKVDGILDAGPSGGAESTVVDATTAKIRVLREGSLGSDKIIEAMGAA